MFGEGGVQWVSGAKYQRRVIVAIAVVHNGFGHKLRQRCNAARFPAGQLSWHGSSMNINRNFYSHPSPSELRCRAI